ncbi:MAG: response regulator [Anaerolineae bacterium]|nr:response regulator [Anaerolineae bacterium]
MGTFSALLVDDDVHVQELFRMVFDHYGHTLRVAKDQASALAVLDGYRPDVIVLDIFLPNTDGYRVLQAIRATYPGLACPVVATTAYYTTDTEGDVLNHGFDGYLLKPISPQELVPYLEGLRRA